MSELLFNKYRAAIEVLQGGREVLVEGLANEILEHGEDLMEGGFLFNEFLETQGTRLHFLGLLMSQLEQAAEALEEANVPPPPPPKAPPKAPAKRRPRAKSKKLEQQAPKKESTDEL